jgi:hypothetical protein
VHRSPLAITAGNEGTTDENSTDRAVDGVNSIQLGEIPLGSALALRPV